MPFFPQFFGSVPSSGPSLAGLYLRVFLPQSFHLPSLQGVLGSSADMGPLTKGFFTHSFHIPNLVYIHLEAGGEINPQKVPLPLEQRLRFF